MQENRYNTCDRFLGGLEKDFIITEQIEDSPLTSEPSFLSYKGDNAKKIIKVGQK